MAPDLSKEQLTFGGQSKIISDSLAVADLINFQLTCGGRS